MHFGRIKSPEKASSGCKCRFIVVNRCVLNHIHNFKAAEKRGYSSWGGGAPVHPLPTPLSSLHAVESDEHLQCVGMDQDRTKRN